MNEDQPTETTAATADSAVKPLGDVIAINEGLIKEHLDKMVVKTVEETLNAMLDAEAEEQCGAKRYERTPDRLDNRDGHYDRQLHTKAGEVMVRVFDERFQAVTVHLRGEQGSFTTTANDRCELRPVMVRYADDLVILARPGQGTELRARLQRWVQANGLTLNEEKTRLVDHRREAFNFLGFSVSCRRGRRSGRSYPHIEPNAKSCGRIREKVRAVLNVRTCNIPSEEIVAQLNRVTQGWARAFHHGNSTAKFGGLQFYVRQTLRRWLWRKHGRTRAQYAHYTDARLYSHYGLWPWPLHAAWTSK
jgi:hypothetical protein